MSNVNVKNPGIEELPGEINADNKHLFPKAARDFYDWAERTQNKILLPHKYVSAQKTHLRTELYKLSKTTPLPAPKDVLVKMVSLMPEIIPAAMLTELAAYILEEWQRLTGDVQQPH